MDSLNYSAILIVFGIFQGSLILVLIYLFLTRLLNSRNNSLDSELEKQRAYDAALDILENAKKESLNVLKASHAKAHKLLGSVSSLTEKSQQTLEDDLHRLSQDHIDSLNTSAQDIIAEFRAALKGESDKGVSEISKTSAVLRGALTEEVDDFKKILHDETITAEETMRSEVRKEFDIIKGDLEAYKREQLSLIDEKIYDILSAITKDVLGQAFSADASADLVKRALEKAKQEGKFTL